MFVILVEKIFLFVCLFKCTFSFKNGVRVHTCLMIWIRIEKKTLVERKKAVKNEKEKISMILRRCRNVIHHRFKNNYSKRNTYEEYSVNLKSLRRYNLSNEIVRIWWESHLGGHCWVPLNNVIKRSFPIQILNELWYSTGAATGSHKNSLVTFTLGKSKLIQNFLFLLSSAGSAFRSRWCPKVGSKIIRFTHIFGSWINWFLIQNNILI